MYSLLLLQPNEPIHSKVWILLSISCYVSFDAVTQISLTPWSDQGKNKKKQEQKWRVKRQCFFYLLSLRPEIVNPYANPTHDRHTIHNKKGSGGDGYISGILVLKWGESSCVAKVYKFVFFYFTAFQKFESVKIRRGKTQVVTDKWNR